MGDPCLLLPDPCFFSTTNLMTALRSGPGPETSAVKPCVDGTSEALHRATKGPKPGRALGPAFRASERVGLLGPSPAWAPYNFFRARFRSYNHA
jgi:hypothetical protein